MNKRIPNIMLSILKFSRNESSSRRYLQILFIPIVRGFSKMSSILDSQCISPNSREDAIFFLYFVGNFSGTLFRVLKNRIMCNKNMYVIL